MKPFRPCLYPVTREDLERFRAMGEGTNKIARRYGCDQSTVRNWLRRLGLPTRNLRSVSQGSTESTGDAV